ncbi:MAG: aminotransferase class V-fold PLP-dependent enzyme [Chloroflexota bacterium]
MQQQTITVENHLINKVQQAMQQAHLTLDERCQRFNANYPDYASTTSIDELRQTDYARLDDLGHTYLDYTGGGLYGESQLQQHMHLLTKNVYGNPHSLNPTSLASTEITESARRYVLTYLNADPDEYVVIFTANASASLKLVGEAYPFDDKGQYLLTFDNHNSVNGIREFARNAGATVTYNPIHADTLRLDEVALQQNLENAIPDGNNLFAYPAQSNFSGIQHDLSWIAKAQALGWAVLLDAAAFLPTNQLDLSQHQPDFVTLSFYKMFGYPTGLGALIAKRSVLEKLCRPWFAGGTISVATVQGDGHYLHDNEAGYEDGTINYLGIPAVEIGLRHMEAIDVNLLHDRLMMLTDYLLDELTQLRHDNGQPLVHIYGDVTSEQRGATLALNFYDADGTVFDYRLVEALANEVNISLRTGCFCNPGAGEVAHNISATRLQECFRSTALSFERLASQLLHNGDTDVVGAVRISLGIVSNFDDVHRFIEFTKIFLNEQSTGITL